MSRQRLEKLTASWRIISQGCDVVSAIGIFYLALALVILWQDPFWVLGLCGVCLGAYAVFFVHRRRHLPTALLIAQHLDRTYPELEESSTLWLRAPESLTLPERLQLARLERAAAELSRRLPPRQSLLGSLPSKRTKRALLWVCAGSCALVAAHIFVSWRPSLAVPALTRSAPGVYVHAIPAVPNAPVWPKITGVGLTVTPPVYTGHPPRQTAGFNAEIEENAAVSWTLAFDRPVRDAHLVFGRAATDRLPLQPTSDQHLQATRPFAETTLYTLAATLPDGTAWTPPEIYSLKVIKDQPPTLRIVQPAAARVVVPPAHPSVSVEIMASDDYAVADAHLFATVAKGSGEAVKFREQSLPFDPDPAPANPPTAQARRFVKTLDLAALGLAPGDELYFYTEASDNRQPTPNRTRSETRFLVLQGPDVATSSAGRGVAGINLVPQYFRSERQIIIDTEKLLANRPVLPDAEFRSRANDLGADQALLRLRYGQFLGEDQEDGPAADHAETNLNPLQTSAPAHPAGPRAAASIAQRFLQEHAAQDNEGGSDEARDSHLRSAPAVPLTADQVRQPFVDSHDTQDKATFFDHQTKGTMRDALSAMWAAEGSLRVAQPQDALAPEHRALDILKELQQSDRAYVQHVGFDAPPLKIDERRLKGDAASVPPVLAVANAAPPVDSARVAVRSALAALSLDGPARTETLQRVEPILTAAATRQPDDFLPGLQSLRRLLVNDATAANDLPALERALLRLLPPAHPLPVRVSDPAPTLAAPYFQALLEGEAN